MRSMGLDASIAAHLRHADSGWRPWIPAPVPGKSAQPRRRAGLAMAGLAG